MPGITTAGSRHNINGNGYGTNRISVGDEFRDKERTNITNGILSILGRDHGATNYGGYLLVDLARKALSAAGKNENGHKVEMVGRALTTSDFPKILANVANKFIMEGWEDSQETWSTWCSVGAVRDFNIHTLVNASNLGDLDEIPESTEYKHGDRTERTEDFKIATYGKLFAISRQAIINDDLGVLSDIPYQHGMSASRKIGDLAYAVLTSNPSMTEDGKQLFHADHKNILTPGAVGTDTLAEGILKMKTQRDISGNQTLAIRPQFCIMPVALEAAGETFFRSEKFDDVAKDATRTNIYAGNYFTRVYDPRLDDDSETAWYLAAARNTVRLLFLDGVQKPFLDSQPGFNLDGVEYKVRIDVAAKALDFRGLSYNAGA